MEKKVYTMPERCRNVLEGHRLLFGFFFRDGGALLRAVASAGTIPSPSPPRPGSPRRRRRGCRSSARRSTATISDTRRSKPGCASSCTIVVTSDRAISFRSSRCASPPWSRRRSSGSGRRSSRVRCSSWSRHTRSSPRSPPGGAWCRSTRCTSPPSPCCKPARTCSGRAFRSWRTTRAFRFHSGSSPCGSPPIS